MDNITLTQGIFAGSSIAYRTPDEESNNRYSNFFFSFFRHPTRGHRKYRIFCVHPITTEKSGWAALKNASKKYHAIECTITGKSKYFDVTPGSFHRRVGLNLEDYKGLIEAQLKEKIKNTLTLESNDFQNAPPEVQNGIAQQFARLLSIPSLREAQKIKLKKLGITLFFNPETKRLLICRSKNPGMVKYPSRKEFGTGRFARGIGSVLMTLNADGSFSVENTVVKKSIKKKFQKTENETNRQSVLKEYQLRKELGEIPGVLNFIDCFSFKENTLIVMPRYEGDLLASPPSTREDQQNAIRTLLTGLAGLRAKGAVHLDIREANMLARERDGHMEYALADFGVMGKKGQPWNMPNEVSIGIFPPEIIQAAQNDTPLKIEKVDSWMAAGLIVKIATRINLFNHGFLTNLKNLQENFKNSSTTEKLNQFHPEFADLLENMLQENPDKRISIEEALLRFEALL